MFYAVTVEGWSAIDSGLKPKAGNAPGRGDKAAQQTYLAVRNEARAALLLQDASISFEIGTTPLPCALEELTFDEFTASANLAPA